MTFDDIKFETHATIPGAVMARVHLPNCVQVSIVGGGYGLYGDGVDTFEVMASYEGTGETIRLQEYDDVLGHQTRQEIEELLARLSDLKHPWSGRWADVRL